jgi:CBS domain-containing protein
MASSEPKVGELGFNEPTIASPDESAEAAWDRMVSSDVDHLAVLQEGRVVGMISRVDLSGPRGGTHRRMGRRVGELMHRDVVRATSRTTVRRAAKLMCEHRTDCLLIVDRQRLTGILTVWQLLAWLVDRSASA